MEFIPTDESLEKLKVKGEEAMRLIQLLLRPTTERAQEIYDYWASMKYWGLEEAAVIGIGLDPNRMDGIQYMNSEDAQRFHKLLKLAAREFKDGRVFPSEFVKWGRVNKEVVDGNVISEIEQRLQKSERPSDATKKENTLLKMVLVMAKTKYNFLNGKTTVHSVALAIKNDFDDLHSDVTLAKGAITAALRRAEEENEPIKRAIKAVEETKAGTRS